MFACQPPRRRSAPASWKCSRDQHRVGVDARASCARIVRATSCVQVVGARSGRSCWRRRSASRRARTARAASARSTESGPVDHARRQRGRAVVELGQRRVLEPADVPGLARRSSSRTGLLAGRGRPARGANHSWPAPVWLVVRSPMSRMPRACTARGRATRTPRRRRAAGRRGRTCSRRSGGWSAPGRPGVRYSVSTPSRSQVVEPRLDARQVAAVQLARRCPGRCAIGSSSQRRRQRPVRQRAGRRPS